jgi:hypothetical protein
MKSAKTSWFGVGQSDLRGHIRLILACMLVLIAVGSDSATAQTGVAEYWDKEFNYAFRYPSSWEVKKLPEGEKNKDVRVVLQGPNGSSFMVVTEKTGKTMSRAEFESNSDRGALVDQMIEQAITQIYRSISRNIQATDMKIGDRMNLSGEIGIKFYVSTLHSLSNGHSVIVAGVHVTPFSKDHMVNFIMTTPWNPGARKDHEALLSVFNSFHMIGEPPRAGTGSKP